MLSIGEGVSSVGRELAERIVHADLKTVGCARQAGVRGRKAGRTGIKICVRRQTGIAVPVRGSAKPGAVHLRHQRDVTVRKHERWKSEIVQRVARAKNV